MIVNSPPKSAPLIFPISVFGEVFFSCDPLCAFLFLLLSSLASPWDQGSFPSTALTNLFFPKSHLCTTCLPYCGLLSSISCAFCSVSPLIDFWSIQNELIFIYLCLRDKSSLGSSYFSAIFEHQSSNSLLRSSLLVCRNTTDFLNMLILHSATLLHLLVQTFF